jgi:ELWxxDGT repeat protein
MIPRFMIGWTLLAVPCLAAWGGPLHAQKSTPDFITIMGDYVLWAADDGLHGRELWGAHMHTGEARMLLDIAPGAASSDPYQFFLPDETRFYFTAWKQETGRELWILNGADNIMDLKPRLVRDIEPGPFSSSPVMLEQVGNLAVFFATTIAYGTEPWVSDGRSEGTSLLADLYPGTAASNMQIYPRCVLNNTLYFMAIDTPNYGARLWRSDGTQAGTRLVLDLADDLTGLVTLGDAFLFGQANGDEGFELWTSDGTAAGTRLLKDINPGTLDSRPRNFHVFNKVVLFQASTLEQGGELWRSDGTPEGTSLVKDIYPGAGTSDPNSFWTAVDAVYFRATDALHGEELWRSDGTPAGTYMVKDIFPGPPSSTPYAFASLGELVFFSARDGVHGEELWSSRGTAETTQLIRDIHPGQGHSEPYWTRASLRSSSIYFTAYTPEHDTQVWRYHPESDTLALVVEMDGGDARDIASTPRNLTRAGDRVFFAANDIEHGEELWIFDPAAFSVRLVKDIFPGQPSSSPAELTPMGDLLLFRADDGAHGDELWRSDGTEAGTALCADMVEGLAGSSPSQLCVVGDIVFFSAYHPTCGEEPFAAQAPAFNPVLMGDIAPGAASSRPRNFTPAPPGIAFSADNGVHGEELWFWQNGHAPRMVRDIASRPLQGAKVQEAIPTPMGVLYAFSTEGHLPGLWLSAGPDRLQRITLRAP